VHRRPGDEKVGDERDPAQQRRPHHHPSSSPSTWPSRAPSIGTVSDALDNGLMEGAVGTYKTECIRTTIFHDGPYRTIADVEYATAGYTSWSRRGACTGPSAWPHP